MADDLRHLTHLLVIDRVEDEDFHRRNGGNAKIRPLAQRANGIALRGQLADILSDADGQRAALSVSADELRSLGTFVTLEGADSAYPLKIDSLQQRTRHTVKQKLPKWLLMSVQPSTDDSPERAVVWVADDYRQEFLKLFEDYLTGTTTQGNPVNWETPTGNPPNRELVANIGRIRRAVLDDLWQSAEAPQKHGLQWFELWLEPTDNAISSLRSFADLYQMKILDRVLVFNDRIVTWAEARWTDLEILPFTSIPLAEIRKPEFIDSIEDLASDEQDEYVQELAGRIVAADNHAPAVCHLDSGVARTHVLLAESLAEDDLHDVIGNSGFDLSGHGTSMAGLALFGKLDDLLTGNGEIRLQHRLESVRVLPNNGEADHDPRDYGTVTIQAVALSESTVQRARVFCVPLSTNADHPGEPTLWSACIDALAAGVDVVRDNDHLKLLATPEPDAARLIVVSAGNVGTYQHDHLAESDTAVVDDPAQAWNALTVGAHTELTAIPTDPQYQGWRPVADDGQLSPHSRTSLLFGPKWPIKPDICMEGGNVLTDGESMFEPRLPLLTLRTTGIGNDSALTSANATSAATAQASRLAALAMSLYPDYWPETIRALLVHSAEWTPAMRAEIDAKKGKKKDQLILLRRYGWGVPTEEAVLRSSQQAVTLVAQDQFVPFEGTNYKMRRFRLHSLPWPADALSEIGAGDVALKVTLSYFIEPSASKRGWRQRYSYASHALRFELQNPIENQQQFIARINREAANDEDSAGTASSGTDRWLVGPDQRNFGSLHQDLWEGSGQELSACNSIAVYPVGGWWKRNTRKDRLNLPIRYSLIVSLKTREENIDLYTPIATQLNIPITTELFGY
ncbi:MAG: S8 family peptidase [Rhodococcus sp. (in: high G+C Gram-positive bacteria)]|uniref:S8 family peptidase n=1 Tax=Rhodococcus sp. BS-15 TaxID=1304954 RepID=UPI000A759386|nr:S8 family peptidase [Rhodococcus sp. BS-15]